LTGSLDKILRIYDLNKPDAEPTKLEGHAQPLKTAIWAADGNMIIAAGQDNAIK
jgi:serine-threonine kinase receptor-associated protein